MKVVIIEDEAPASRRLERILKESENEIEILAILESVESSVNWFKNNSMPELLFMDIQLSDGLSFEIFKQVEIKCPIIFTTAYDEYAIQAFKVNSIDYLLKPIDIEDLSNALEKFHNLKSIYNSQNKNDIAEILKNLNFTEKVYKERFLIKSGSNFNLVQVEEIAFFCSDNKLTNFTTFSNKRHFVDYTLDELESLLNPKNFFRVNRQYIININAVENISSFFSSKLKLKLKNHLAEEIIISRERASQFKKWLDR